MSDGAIVTIRYRLRNFMDHDEPDWDELARELILEEGVLGMCDDQGEILSIEKWDAPEPEGKEKP